MGTIVGWLFAENAYLEQTERFIQTEIKQKIINRFTE